MAASTMAQSLMGTRVSMRTAPAQQRRSVQVVRSSAAEEPTSRRAALGLLAGAIGGLGLTGAAEAGRDRTKVAYQDSIARSGSSTTASMSGYTMEGTRKRGLNPAERKKYLAEQKEEALRNASK